MQTRIALGVSLLAFIALAKSPWIVPHVETNGVITWTATIDAANVEKFKVDDDVSGSQARRALEAWLTQHLAEVSWCKYGWRYRYEKQDEYIEDLGKDGLRVLGVCKTPDHQSLLPDDKN